LTESGQVVEGVTISSEIVNVRVPIRSIVGIKRVPVEPQLSGAPASGYIVRDVSVEPQLVSLTGSSGPLDQVLSVTTEAVDISGASETITRTVAINQPAGAAFQEAQSPTATVVVRFAPIERQFSVTLPVRVQGINPPRNVQVSISPQVVDVTFSGTAAEFDALDAQTLIGSINLRNLSPGTYQRAPDINVPDGLTLVGDVPAVTVTLQPPPTETPEPTVAPTPTATPAPAEPTTEAPAAPTNTPEQQPTVETPTAPPADQTPTP
jgi:YbbR domain-containing protein